MRPIPLIGLLLAAGCSPPDDSEVRPPAVEETAGQDSSLFVSSESCATCHAEHSARWLGSHHDLAMQEATRETVLGDFEDVSFESAGRTTRFTQREDSFYVLTEGPDGEDHEYRVIYTFGVDPLQQYLLEFPGGRLQCLDVAWSSVDGEWFDLNEGQRVAAGDPYHWTGRFQSWNLQCADCHSTAFEKNYDAATDTYQSRWQEINVGCQACHGPAAGHVQLAQSWNGRRPEGAPSGFEFDLRRDDAARVINTCAPCHSRRSVISETHKIGASFDEDYQLALLEPGLYHPDGQIRGEVYVHGSFLQSKMFTAGVSCVDCHDPHSTKLWFPGDTTCLQCHSPTPPLDRFKTLQAKPYADPSHHFHPQESEGARCVNCHMPETTYMVIDPRRDHSLRVPRPDLTITLGTPNACNECHAAETPEWAAAKVEEWYGHAPEQHFGSSLGASNSSPQEDIDALFAMPFNPDAPAIVKATALDLLPAGTPMAMQSAVALLNNDETDLLVRAAAVRALRDSDPQIVMAFGVPLLQDPSRRIRIEAAQLVAGPAEAQLTDEQRAAFEAALAEFEAAQRAIADEPSSHLNLGVIRERRGRRREAIESYRHALELDSGFLPAIFNLATLLNATGDNMGAKELLLVASERFPEEGELQYSLGLLLSDMDDPEGVAKHLAEAARLMPGRPRVHYNLGLALGQIGDRTRAENAFLQANRLAPEDPDFLYVLATFYLEGGDLELALDWAGRLRDRLPEAPGPLELVKEIEQRMEQGR